MAAITKPLSSPLPPVPSKFTGMPPMSIPRRRPVAAPTTPAPAPTPISPPAATPALASDPSPSPVGSFSSLLSAYSNHTADSPRSSLTSSAKDMIGSGGAYSVVSPNLDTQRTSAQSKAPTYALPPLPSDQMAQKHEPGGQMFEDLPPPPPLKDAQRSTSRPQTPTGSQTQNAQQPTSARMGSPLTGGSPQQEQLWRRRSLKTDKALAVPDLKLVSSHGSTAASAQDTAQSSPSSLFSQPFPLPPGSNPNALEPATTPRAPPRSANGGLPGRNIRPVPSEQTAPQDANMGQEASRIKEKLENARRRGSGDESRAKMQATQVSRAEITLSPTTSPQAVSPLSAHRLPTPEYSTHDVRNPQPDTVVSPLSPASSPELPGEARPISRKALGVPEAQVRHAGSSSPLVPGPINTGLGVRSPMGLPSSPRPDMNQGSAQTQPLPPLSLPDRNPGPIQTQPLPPLPDPDRAQLPTQPQYRAYSPAIDRNETPNQKQYIPYSPPSDRTPGPVQTQAPVQTLPNNEEDLRPLPAAGSSQEPPPLSAPQPVQQPAPGPAQNLPRPPLPRTVSETGSIETLKQPPVRPQPNNPNADFASPEDAPLREPDPSQPDTTDNPGAALFPRNWYTPLPADAPIPDARPLTERHYRCLTRHRYLTANRQRRNPLACRVCGHKDRNAEAWICSACHLNVCEGCKGALGKLRGDLDAVLGAVSRGRKDVRDDRGRRQGGEVVAGLQG